MATRFLHLGLPIETSPYSNVAPFTVDEDGELKIVRGEQFKGVASSDPGAERIPIKRVVALTANATLTVADSGGVFIVSGSDIVLTLPATEKGLTYTLVVGGLSGGATGHAFSPAAADKIMGNGFTAADDKDAICSAASDRIGDSLTLVGDGADGWYITAVTGTWALQA